jgi:hypothetical protein
MANTITRDGNRLTLTTLSDPCVPADFVSVVRDCQRRGFCDVVLDFANVQGVYPNAAAPLAGLIQHYINEVNIEFEYENVSPYLERTAALNPATVQLAGRAPLNKVWSFTGSNEISALTNGFISAVAEFTVCEPGVLNAIGFCVYEVLDNVLLHSESNCGFAMAQIHPTAKHIALCIYDTGQGIYNSLRASHSPTSALHAIETSMQKDVTSGKGAGFGLWGLQSIVRSNSGRLTIGSGSGLYVLRQDGLNTSDRMPFLSRERNCTAVDFQIEFDKPIVIADALGGYTPVDFFIDNVEDDFGNALLLVSTEAPGTGTRNDGAIARNRALNFEKLAEGRVLIDFAGIEHISASFADEFIAKLVTEVGIERFRDRFILLNRTQFVADIIDRATAKRVRGV